MPWICENLYLFINFGLPLCKISNIVAILQAYCVCALYGSMNPLICWPNCKTIQCILFVVICIVHRVQSWNTKSKMWMHAEGANANREAYDYLNVRCNSKSQTATMTTPKHVRNQKMALQNTTNLECKSQGAICIWAHRCCCAVPTRYFEA